MGADLLVETLKVSATPEHPAGQAGLRARHPGADPAQGGRPHRLEADWPARSTIGSAVSCHGPGMYTRFRGQGSAGVESAVGREIAWSGPPGSTLGSRPALAGQLRRGHCHRVAGGPDRGAPQGGADDFLNGQRPQSGETLGKGERVKLPLGYRFASTYAGIRKDKRDDLALIVSDVPASAAGLFTTNLVQAAPVQICREHLKLPRGSARAILANAGNANCATRTAMKVAAACCREAAGAAEDVAAPGSARLDGRHRRRA